VSNSERRIVSSHTMVSDFAPVCDCGAEAEAFLEVHAVDYCTPEVPSWAKLLCRGCLKRDVEKVQNILLDGRVWCSSCGLTMHDMGDMVVRLSPLWAIGEP
jgi:hypothetical protein